MQALASKSWRASPSLRRSPLCICLTQINVHNDNVDVSRVRQFEIALDRLANCRGTMVFLDSRLISIARYGMFYQALSVMFNLAVWIGQTFHTGTTRTIGGKEREVL